MVRSSPSDKVTVVGAGVTLEEAMKAADILKAEGVNIRVVDPFTLKPIDKELLTSCAKATGGRVVVVEDHYAQGRLSPTSVCVCGRPTLPLPLCVCVVGPLYLCVCVW